MNPSSATASDPSAVLQSFVGGERGRALRTQLAVRHPERSAEEIEEAIQSACKCFLDEAEGISAPGAAAWGEGDPVPGDLDDLQLGADKCGGLDAPLDRSAISEEDDADGHWDERWELWQRGASERGLRLETYRDVIEFMAAVGLVERRVEDGAVWWRPTMPAPLAEDVLPLDDDERRMHAQLRWNSIFAQAENRIVGWLVEQRGEGEVLEIETSMRALADTLDLDLDDARHGLACANSPEISSVPDPEGADPAEPLSISVNWQQFDENRFAIRLGMPDE